ncbi:2,3-diaminopropionate biosynthesis protein SbnB [Streptomyces sp. NPDC088560]|uniref:2,3-diaminopropionate biosynthesis protein SbnB n=1 Tax=Streptomyces sp. NPDC088560 TaxID=3365868 RepID=UPI003804B5E9
MDGRENDVLDAVRRAYVAHAAGESSVPHSVFLRFPDNPKNRIIGLPSYLGDANEIAGIKWISSFPDNVSAGLERASAVIIINSLRTGHPEALIEGSLISARRTAASAALAVSAMPGAAAATGVSLIGCGVINREVLQFLRVVAPGIRSVRVFDVDRWRASEFVQSCPPGLEAEVAKTIGEAMAANPLVSIASTAAVPHVGLEHCQPGSLVLHLSLRDLTPQSVLEAVNVVDDADHVCRAATSLHLAEQRVGNRDFIAQSIGEILSSSKTYRRNPGKVTVFSPFGLGILDLAVARLVRNVTVERGWGVRHDDFLPYSKATPVSSPDLA